MPFDTQYLRHYWDTTYENIQRSTACGESVRDIYFAQIEKRALLEKLDALLPRRFHGSCLEVGCGTGELLGVLKTRYPMATFTGVDISNVVRKNNRAGITLLCEDVFESFSRRQQQYDLIICRRVVINMLTLRRQRLFFTKAHHALKPKGLLIIQELFEERLKKHNRLRRQFALPPYGISSHLKPLREKWLLAEFKDLYRIQEFNYLNSYMLCCYVLYPAISTKIEHNTEIHRMASAVEDAGEFGPYKGFVLRKR